MEPLGSNEEADAELARLFEDDTPLSTRTARTKPQEPKRPKRPERDGDQAGQGRR